MVKNLQLIEVLNDLGLTENEANVYLANLSLGPTTILKISKVSGLRRTTVYSVIDSLKVKGLIHIEPKGFKKLFVSEHPDKLKSMLDLKRISLEQVLPQFTALYNLKGGESTIKYYEGLESVKTIYDTILEPLTHKDYYLVIGDLQKFFDMDRDYFEAYLEKRIKTRIQARLITTDSKQAQHMKKFSKNMNQEVRILPKDTVLSVDVMITPQKVTIFSLSEPLSAISLENKAMVEMHKELFELLWKTIPE